MRVSSGILNAAQPKSSGEMMLLSALACQTPKSMLGRDRCRQMGHHARK